MSLGFVGLHLSERGWWGKGFRVLGYGGGGRRKFRAEAIPGFGGFMRWSLGDCKLAECTLGAANLQPHESHLAMMQAPNPQNPGPKTPIPNL